MNKTTATLTALTALYALAGTPLEAYAAPVSKAIERAVQVRADHVKAPGSWQTDRDGKPLPSHGVIVTHIGGNGG